MHNATYYQERLQQIDFGHIRNSVLLLIILAAASVMPSSMPRQDSPSREDCASLPAKGVFGQTKAVATNAEGDVIAQTDGLAAQCGRLQQVGH